MTGPYPWPVLNIVGPLCVCLDIEMHVEQCLSCAETKGTTQTAPILLPAGPFNIVGIDLLQLSHSIQGSIYVLVCVNHFSCFTVLAPLPNKSATTVAHALFSHLICPYTTPRVLPSDTGTEFKNQVFRDICTQFHIQQTFITSHHPGSNGLIECINRKILEILCYLAGHLQETWEDWLSHVAASINGSVNSSTGKMPHYILYGFEKCLPYNVLVPSPVPLYSQDDYSKLQLHYFQTIHNSIQEKLKASREKMLHKQHSQHASVHFDVDDSVVKRAPDRSCKLTPKFSGPFLLTAKLHSNKFKLLDLSTSVSEVVHVHSLKKASTSFTPAAVPSSPSPTDLPSPPDAHPSRSYRLRSAEHH